MLLVDPSALVPVAIPSTLPSISLESMRASALVSIVAASARLSDTLSAVVSA